MLTYGGGPADRIHDEYGRQEAGVRLRVFSDITGNEFPDPVITGPHGRIPQFQLPREWEWTQVSLVTDAGDRWLLPVPREVQGAAAVFHLREKVDALEAEIAALRADDSEEVGDAVREGDVAGAGVDG